jgi:hypothetical protein
LEAPKPVVLYEALWKQISQKMGGSEFQERVESDPRIKIAGYFDIFVRGIILAYWIFILALAINLHKAKRISMVELICIIVFVPLAVLFYFVSMRKKFKQMEAGSGQSRAATQ